MISLTPTREVSKINKYVASAYRYITGQEQSREVEESGIDLALELDLMSLTRAINCKRKYLAIKFVSAVIIYKLEPCDAKLKDAEAALLDFLKLNYSEGITNTELFGGY